MSDITLIPQEGGEPIEITWRQNHHWQRLVHAGLVVL